MTYEDNKTWRLKNPDKRNAGRRRYYRQFQNAQNSGKRWSDEDKDEVMMAVSLDRELHHMLGRSVAAIQHMRCKLWKEYL